MNEFEKDVIDRLARIETKQDGIDGKLLALPCEENTKRINGHAVKHGVYTGFITTCVFWINKVFGG